MSRHSVDGCWNNKEGFTVHISVLTRLDNNMPNGVVERDGGLFEGGFGSGEGSKCCGIGRTYRQE